MPTNATVDLEKLWGGRVKDRRKLLGLTQRQLAERVEPPTTQGTIWKIEKGEITPRDSLKLGIAKALCSTPADLFPWEA